MVLGLILSLIPTYGNLCRLLAFGVGMLFPTLESFKAIESKQLGDDTQWLMYWVCYSVLLSVEQVAWPFLAWIPLYRLLRVGALAWLALPQTRGAALLYESFVRPFLLVAVEKARELPALEPYARDFMPAARRGKSAESEAPSQAEAAGPAAGAEQMYRPASPGAAAVDFDTLKREAMQKVEETFEKAKQQAAASEEEERHYQPLKAHAT